jgi:hypothetical protein
MGSRPACARPGPKESAQAQGPPSTHGGGLLVGQNGDLELAVDTEKWPKAFDLLAGPLEATEVHVRVLLVCPLQTTRAHSRRREF